MLLTEKQLDRFDLPIPMDRPLTGQDLLAVIPHVIQPAWTAAARALTYTLAAVTAVTTSPARVNLLAADGTALTAVPYLRGYTPRVGDEVFVLLNATQRVVLAAIA